MRKFIALAVLVLGMSFLAAAQEVPQVEIFGGYSFLHLDKQDLQSYVSPTTSINQNTNGWEASVQYNINKWLGGVADFGGNYGGSLISDPSVPGSIGGGSYNFLFGPQVNIRGNKMKGFVHALFGVNHLYLNQSTSLGTPAASDNAFGMALGGGVDVKVSKRFAVRVGQFDYLMSNHDFGMGHQNNFRYSAGVVFNLGQK